MAVKKKSNYQMVKVVQPNAAGIDIGAKEIYVAIPKDRAKDSVRRFDSFTDDLHEAAKWLKANGIESIAMESTGVYWIPVYQILDAYGFSVYLVNARHAKNVPGRKTDVKDSQWLQYLHSVGLLESSYRPAQEVCAIRSLLRHRDSTVKMASSHVQHMQKALTQMNIHLHNVISDITGETGLKILDSILSGNHDPRKLADLKSARIRASKETIVKSLTGDYRMEHLFTLRQSLESYRFYKNQIYACDKQIEILVKEFESSHKTDDDEKPPLGNKPSTKNAPQFDVKGEMHRVFGTDLTCVDGINVTTILTLFAEIGPDLSKFKTVKHFCSWMGLSPNNKISGGKRLSSKTNKNSNKAATAFRLAAYSLYRSNSYLGDFYRAKRARLGTPKAVTATAHKLARIFYYLVKNRQSYDDSVFRMEEQKNSERKLRYIQKQAKEYGLQLVKTDSLGFVT